MTDKVKTEILEPEQTTPRNLIGTGIAPPIYYLDEDRNDKIKEKEDTGQLYTDIHIGMFDVTKTGSGGFEGVSKKDSGIDATLKITHAKIPGSDNHRASIYTKLTFEGTKEEIEEMLRKIGDAVEK